MAKDTNAPPPFFEQAEDPTGPYRRAYVASGGFGGFAAELVDISVFKGFDPEAPLDDPYWFVYLAGTAVSGGNVVPVLTRMFMGKSINRAYVHGAPESFVTATPQVLVYGFQPASWADPALSWTAPRFVDDWDLAMESATACTTFQGTTSDGFVRWVVSTGNAVPSDDAIAQWISVRAFLARNAATVEAFAEPVVWGDTLGPTRSVAYSPLGGGIRFRFKGFRSALVSDVTTLLVTFDHPQVHIAQPDDMKSTESPVGLFAQGVRLVVVGSAASPQGATQPHR